MVSHHRKAPAPAPGPLLSAADLAAAMGEANRAGDLAEVYRLMLVAASNRRLAAGTWAVLAAELAGETATPARR